jgi:hypothetical protein
MIEYELNGRPRAQDATRGSVLVRSVGRCPNRLHAINKILPTSELPTIQTTVPARGSTANRVLSLCGVTWRLVWPRNNYWLDNHWHTL